MRRRLAASCLAIALFAGTAAADSAAEVDQLFAEGRALLERNDARGACNKFEAAIALDPTAPGVILNLGLCYERLGQWATSLYWFRKAQAVAAESALPPEYKAAAERFTVELAAKVTTIRVDVSQAPPSVDVYVDGRRVPPTEYARVEVNADSVIQATAPGRGRFRQQLAARTRDAGTIAIQLGPPPGQTRRRASYGLVAGGVLTVGAAVAYGLVVQDNYNSKPTHTPDERDDAEHKLQLYGTGLAALGIGLVATGVVLYLTSPSPDAERAPLTSLAPLLTRDTAGFAVSGRF